MKVIDGVKAVAFLIAMYAVMYGACAMFVLLTK